MKAIRPGFHIKGSVRRLILGTGVLLIIYWAIPLPDPVFKKPYSTVLRDASGRLLSAFIAEDDQWRFAPTDSIPEKFTVAILLYEDEYFFQHPGVNPISIGRALLQNIRAGKVKSGGSTLTMQVVRMALGNQSRTYIQKTTEILISLKLDLLYSKNSILKLYANHAPFGGNIVGLNAASWRYFGRPPELLSWAESATLAVLPNDPRDIFPGKNMNALLEKRNALLDKIYEKGHMDSDGLFLAKHEPLPTKLRPLPNLAPHLIQRAIKEGNEGKNIHSTLQFQLQKQVTAIVDRHSLKMSGNEINNAAAIVLDIKTGSTLAYKGNTRNTGVHGSHVDIITSQRSPGSLLKPFLYAAALDEGLILPRQLLPDVPLFYEGFAPKNFDKKFRGAVHADNALISSLNVPFVHLLKEYGYERFHQKLTQLGFKSFNEPASHYGLSIILGGAETSLWEITSVYSGMARALNQFPLRPFKNGYSAMDFHSNKYLISTEKTEVPLQADGPIRAPSLHHTFDALRQLRRPESETGWKHFEQSLNISWKTGTSYGFRDGWAIGFNEQYLVGVWVGNADGEGRPGLTGIAAAAPLLFDLFELLPNPVNDGQSYGTEQETCEFSGMLASKFCHKKASIRIPDYMVESARACTYHQQLHLDKTASFQVNSSCYPISEIQTVHQFILPPTQAWYYQKYHPNYKPIPPLDPACADGSADLSFDLIYPRQFTKVHIPIEQDGQPGQAIFEAAHQNHEATIHWHIDDVYLGSTSSEHQMGIQAEKGPHILTLIDQSGREIKQAFEVIN